MKAVAYTRYGTPDVLKVCDLPKPVPKDDEVLVNVFSVSLNDWDVALLEGDIVNRILNGFTRPKIQILGSDVAGRVEAVGKNVRKFKPGDDVYGDLSGRWGGFAEYVCAREDALALKPGLMSFEEAAAIPQAAMLAVQGLIDRGNIQKGQKILVNGAGGGVGTFAVQIARSYGVEMTGVDNASKLELMRSIGYDHVIDYARQDFTRNGEQYDLILDAKTNRSIFDYAHALRPNGVYVTVGGSLPKLLQAFLFSPLVTTFGKKKIRIVALKPNKDLDYMNALFERGQVKPVIDGPYRLEEAPRLFSVFLKGLHKGKIVFTVARP
jgi:NADPH:quinone reductase-like Zn-dependent oxidoreductase